MDERMQQEKWLPGEAIGNGNSISTICQAAPLPFVNSYPDDLNKMLHLTEFRIAGHQAG
ncbi:MAG: hypothetical protein FD174_1481 [Geobacteraceae bacterium]|nr:MAG: hypothetical protein FD174_1481 [Geobacteraceae bacterium]